MPRPLGHLNPRAGMGAAAAAGWFLLVAEVRLIVELYFQETKTYQCATGKTAGSTGLRLVSAGMFKRMFLRQNRHTLLSRANTIS